MPDPGLPGCGEAVQIGPADEDRPGAERQGGGDVGSPADPGVEQHLTTAASVWVTAAVGAAAGAGLLVLAALTTGMYLVVILILPVARRRLPLTSAGTSTLRVRYLDGHGILRKVLSEATKRGFTIDELYAEPADDRSLVSGTREPGAVPAMVAVTMHVHGKRPVVELADALTDLDLVDTVVATDHPAADE